MDDGRRRDYVNALRAVAAIIDERVQEPVVDKTALLRAMGEGMGLVLALCIEVLGDSGRVGREDPRQRTLFPDAGSSA